MGDAAGFIVFADMFREILVRAIISGRHGFGMKNKAIGMSLDELGEVLDFKAAGGYKLIERFRIIDVLEMAFEDDTVKTVERAGNLIGNFVGKRFHGVLSW